MLRVIFMGTPLIGKYALEALLELKDDIEVVGVVCQPDREFNRKKEVVYSKVKELALEKNLRIFQPEKISLIKDDLLALKPDLLVTCAFGQFIPNDILAIPKYKPINLHASLLPKLRGGAPIHWAIINGEKKTGISLMEMVKKMDAGPYFVQYECDITNTDTMSSLYDKLCLLVKKVIHKELLKAIAADAKWIEQDEALATFGYNVKKEDCFIDFNEPVFKVDCLIRGLYNKPLAIWTFDGLNIKVHEAQITDNVAHQSPGEIVKVSKNGIEIACQDYNILLTKIQLPNKNAMYVKDILNGTNPFTKYLKHA